MYRNMIRLMFICLAILLIVSADIAVACKNRNDICKSGGDCCSGLICIRAAFLSVCR
nr:venom peptide [Acharia stimulea]